MFHAILFSIIHIENNFCKKFSIMKNGNQVKFKKKKSIFGKFSKIWYFASSDCRRQQKWLNY